MEFKDYYAILGVEKSASAEEIRHAYRKLARKYHPDLNKEADAEDRFKEIGEAYKALSDPEKRAAYDDVGRRYRNGEEFHPPPGWDEGFAFSGRDFGPNDAADLSDFFQSLFGRHAGGARASGFADVPGRDHHAKIEIDLADAYRGARRTISLRMPVVDAQGRVTLQEKVLEVTIPKGVHAGQHLLLAGQGGQSGGAGPAGNLYLEITFREHPNFRVDGRDVYFNLALAPWEAALGASVMVPTPDGEVSLAIAPGSSSGRKLRLRGKGIPGKPPGNLYAVIAINTPPADSQAAKDAYAALARAVPGFNPRGTLEA